MDHYATLGVAKNATPEEIKKAYRKLASTHHPDKGGDTATFQKIEEAYRILSDPNTRQQYDNPRPQGPNFDHFNNFNDIFAQFFGQQNNPFNRPNTTIYRTQVWVTLEQVYNGGEQLLNLNINGKSSTTVKIEIPVGIENGTQIRYNNIIPNSSLLIEFVIHKHSKYERKGIDLYSTVDVSVLDLIVGTEIEFQSISGKVFSVKVHPKTSPNSLIRLPNIGMRENKQSNTYGDQYLLINAVMPDTISQSIIDSILSYKQRTKNEQFTRN